MSDATHASIQQDGRVFLSAEWRDLVMLNYEVDPGLVRRYVPSGTELDSFEGRTYVSLVGFRFLNTKLFGFAPVPFHANFDEVNLRFYVRRREGKEDRRGVVFIREIVPKRAIAWVARLVYGENYVRCPMTHKTSSAKETKTAEYSWIVDGKWCRLYATGNGTVRQPAEGSVEQFITEHYWGYTPRRGGGTIEYHVSHVPWNVWSCSRAGFIGNADPLYGPALGDIFRRSPHSAFIADGSSVNVYPGRQIG